MRVDDYVAVKTRDRKKRLFHWRKLASFLSEPRPQTPNLQYSSYLLVYIVRSITVRLRSLIIPVEIYYMKFLIVLVLYFPFVLVNLILLYIEDICSSLLG